MLHLIRVGRYVAIGIVLGAVALFFSTRAGTSPEDAELSGVGVHLDYCAAPCPQCTRACSAQKGHSGQHGDVKGHKW